MPSDHTERPPLWDDATARRVLEQLPVPTFVVDSQGRPCFVNGAAADILATGLTPGDGSLAALYAVRRHGGGAYPTEELPLVQVLRGRAYAIADDLEVARADESVVPIEVMAAPVHDRSGRLTNAVALLSDLTGRRATHEVQALRAAIVEASDAAVISVDTDAVVTSWNGAAAEIYGYSVEEAVGHRLEALLPGEDTAESGAWRRALRGHGLPKAQRDRRRKDGSSITVSEILFPLRNREGGIVGAASMSRDVSAQRRAEDMLALGRRRLERENARLQRVNAGLAEFARSASDDLSEPLRAVSGMVQLLARRYRGRLDAEADEFIDSAVAGCSRMKDMLDGVLSYVTAGQSDAEQVDVDVTAVAVEVVASLDRAITEAGATVVMGPLPTLRVDQTRLGQLLFCLLDNAVKFRSQDTAPVVEVTSERDGAAWRICVTDNGIGIDSRNRSRIFQMFERLHVDSEYPGAGAGLAVAERIVIGFGGRLWVEPRRTGGSHFCFTVPDSSDPEHPADAR